MFRILSLLFITYLCGLSICSSSPKEWLCNGRDVTGSTAQAHANSISKTNAPLLTQKWTALGEGITGAPVVKSEVVYVARFDGSVQAYSVNDGTLKWSSGFNGGQCENSPAIGKNIYAACRDTPVSPNDVGPAVVASFNKNTGALMWKTSLTPGDLVPTSQQIAPIVASGLVIVGTNSGEETDVEQFPNGTYHFTFYAKVYALDENTGNIVWQARTSYYSHGASPGFSFAADLNNGRLYLGTGNAYDVSGPDSCSLLCLNLHTGARIFDVQINAECVWSVAYPGFVDQSHCTYPPDYDVGTYPQIFDLKSGDDSLELVGITDKLRNYTVVDRNTGALVWRTPLIPPCNNPSLGGTPGAAYLNGVIYVLALYDPNNLLTPDVVIGAAKGDFGDIITVLNGYISALKTTLTALNATDGSVIWQNTYDGVYFGSPSVTGSGVLFVGSFSGLLRVVDADTGAELRTPFQTNVNSLLNSFLPGARDPVNTVATIVDGDSVQIFVGTGFSFVTGGMYTFGVNTSKRNMPNLNRKLNEK
jgi:outer membrane protein assembly factor BamB